MLGAPSFRAEGKARLPLSRGNRVALQLMMMYMCMTETKQSRSLRLTPEAKRLVRALATPSGISMAAVLAIMIREQAQRKGVQHCPY